MTPDRVSGNLNAFIIKSINIGKALGRVCVAQNYDLYWSVGLYETQRRYREGCFVGEGKGALRGEPLFVGASYLSLVSDLFFFLQLGNMLSDEKSFAQRHLVAFVR